MSERGRKEPTKRKRQGIVPPQAPVKRDYSAIRALPKPIVGENEWWDFFDGDLFMAPSEQPRFWQVLQAAHEAQALLPEYEAQSKRHDRAVELLRRLVNAYGEALKAAYYPLAVVDAKEFLRELGGSDEDTE